MKRPVVALYTEPDRTHSGRFTDLAEDKLRGGYYTSSEVASWLCSWAIRSPTDKVLEPSCGDGAFLDAAALRFTELGVKDAAIAKGLTQGCSMLSRRGRMARYLWTIPEGEGPHEAARLSHDHR